MEHKGIRTAMKLLRMDIHILFRKFDEVRKDKNEQDLSKNTEQHLFQKR